MVFVHQTFSMVFFAYSLKFHAQRRDDVYAPIAFSIIMIKQSIQSNTQSEEVHGECWLDSSTFLVHA